MTSPSALVTITSSLTSNQLLPKQLSPGQLSSGNALTRFGGKWEKLGSSLDKFIPITQNITEDFFWQFMTLDVLGLWVTRIWNSLARGRKPYHQDEDPSWNPNLTETQQLGKIVKGTVTGLNWGYFGEEAGREFLIGPGVLAIFGSLYGVYRMMLNPAIRMPAQPLQTITDSFGQYLYKTVGDNPVNQKDIPAHIKQFLISQVADPQLKASVSKPLTAWAQQWQTHSQELSHYLQSQSKVHQWRDNVQYWWKTRPFQPAKQATQGLAPAYQQLLASRQALEASANEFKEAVLAFNRYEKPVVQYDSMHQISLIMQQRSKGTLKAAEQLMDVEHWITWMDQWHHVAADLSRQIKAHPAKPATAVVSSVLGGLNRTKIGAVVSAMVICGAYLRWLTREFQNSKKYPGNRERRAGDLKDELKDAATHHRKPPLLPMGAAR